MRTHMRPNREKQYSGARRFSPSAGSGHVLCHQGSLEILILDPF